MRPQIMRITEGCSREKDSWVSDNNTMALATVALLGGGKWQNGLLSIKLTNFLEMVSFIFSLVCFYIPDMTNRWLAYRPCTNSWMEYLTRMKIL
jgi:hypothetical protein